MKKINTMRHLIVYLVFPVALLSGCNCTQGLSGSKVVPVDTPTVESDGLACSTTFTLRGTKPSSTSLEIDGVEAVPFDEAITWQVELSQTDDQRSYNIVAIDARDMRSETLQHLVSLVDSTPAVPIINAVDALVLESPLNLSGSKESGAAIWINGLETVPKNGETTFSSVVDLVPGNNTLTIVSSNGCRDSEPVLIDTYFDTIVVRVEIIAPLEGALIGGDATIFGIAAAGSAFASQAIDRVEISIDGAAPQSTTGAENWSFNWDTSALTDRSGHSISAQAFDVDGTASEPATIDVTIFSGQILVTEDPVDEAFGTSRRPAVATHPTTAGVAAIAWHDNGTVGGSDQGNTDIYVSTFANATLAAPLRLNTSASDGGSQNVVLTIDKNGVVYALWQDRGSYDADAIEDFDIVMSTVTDGVVGTTTLVSDDTFDGESQYPSIALEVDPEAQDRIHLVWQEDGSADGDGVSDNDILYSVFDGAGWSPPLVVSAEAADSDIDDFQPQVAVDQAGTVHVVWQCNGSLDGNQDADGDICYARKTGASFSLPELVADAGSQFSVQPRIAADPGSLVGLTYLVWVQAGDILMRTRDDGAFGPVMTLSDDVADTVAGFPYVAVAPSGDASFLWSTTGDIGGVGADFDIFSRRMNPALGAYNAISDSGTDVNQGTSNAAAVAIDSAGTLYVVWQDNSDLNGAGTDDDIFFVVR